MVVVTAQPYNVPRVALVFEISETLLPVIRIKPKCVEPAGFLRGCGGREHTVICAVHPDVVYFTAVPNALICTKTPLRTIHYTPVILALIVRVEVLYSSTMVLEYHAYK